jgi:AraC-like DNA-binding protein
MLARGVSAADLLANTELQESDLSEPYTLISEAQARSYYRNVVSLGNEDGIGLEIGWLTGLSQMGPLGMSQLAAPTVGDILRETHANRLVYYLLGDWQLDITADLVINRFIVGEPEEPLRIFLIERGLGTIQANVEELCGSEATPVRVLLDYKVPANFQRYKEIFRCPVRFNQPTVELHYPAKYLDLEIETYDPQAREVLGALRDNLREKLVSGGDIVNEVKLALRRQQGKFPSLEQIADSLAISSRTLRRKLGQQDARYQNLLDEERQRVAKDFLLNTTMSIQQIAEQCGFNDAQNFSQAFKRWQGMSPTEYRQSHGN